MRQRTLRGTLGWLLASLIAPMALGTLTVLALESHRSREVERERLATLARTLLSGVDAELGRAQAQLQVLALSAQLARGERAELHAWMKAVADASSGSVITLVDAHGQALLSSATRPGEPLPNYWSILDANRRMPWNGGSLRVGSEDLRRATQENRIVYSNLFYGLNVRRPALALAVPAHDAAGARYAFVLVFAPALLQDMVTRSVGASGVRVLVTDRQETVIARNAESPVQVGERAVPVPETANRSAGLFRIRAIDNRVLEGAFAVSPASGYVVRVAQAAPSPLLPAWALTWLAVLVLASAVALGLVIFFGRQLARPIRLLAADLGQGRAPGGDFGSKIVEFQLLAGAVSAAVEAEHFRRAEEERKANELRDRALFAEQMVGIVSHDLRNPLLAAELSATALGRAAIPPDSQLLLQQVHKALHRAQSLVRELLDFTRARIGRGLPVDLAPVELHQLLAEHVQTLRRSYPEHQLLHECAGQGPCEADANRLLQVTDNLVHNAVTYGDREHPVVIRTSIDPHAFSITVHNHGEPIPQDVLGHVFHPMLRTASSPRQAQGVGLGLYIVAEIARAHAGEATVTSGWEEGTTVVVSFPR